MSNRDSQSQELELITDPDEKARVEAENAIRQTKSAMDLLPKFIAIPKAILRPSHFLNLHGILMQKISQYPGVFRPGPMSISNSSHVPPPASEVAGLVESLCDYVNDNWEKKSAIHLAAYILWRTNWIHPFSDGNGRTARIVSNLILCAHTKTELPGVPTIPEQISLAKKPYYKALEEADRNFRKGEIDVSELEELLGACLAHQLIKFFQQAAGSNGEMDENLKLEISNAVSLAQAEGIVNRDANAVLPSLKRKSSILDFIERRPVLFGAILVPIVGAIIGWLFSR